MMNKPKNYNEMPNDKFSRGFFKNESEPLYHFRNVFILLPKRTDGRVSAPPVCRLVCNRTTRFSVIYARPVKRIRLSKRGKNLRTGR